MILPAMGVVTEIFPTFSQKPPVFGYGSYCNIQPRHRTGWIF
ncbi:MAG: hypothetical protein R2744_10350 [Bacteroidales bacterium]